MGQIRCGPLGAPGASMTGVYLRWMNALFYVTVAGTSSAEELGERGGMLSIWAWQGVSAIVDASSRLVRGSLCKVWSGQVRGPAGVALVHNTLGSTGL